MRRTLILVSLLAAGCRGDAPPATPANPSAPDRTDAAPGGTGDPRPSAAGDSVTVLFFGDSLTEGYGLAGGKQEAYPALVAERAADEGIPLRVMNAGVSGNTSADGRARIQWTLSRQRPDVFVLALGGNDGLRGISPEAMQANLRAILEAVRTEAPRARIVIAGMEAPPNYGPDYTDRFRAVFPALADEFDAELIPFLLGGVAGNTSLNQRDRIHPTARGQEIIADLVWEALEPLLRAGVRDGQRAIDRRG